MVDGRSIWMLSCAPHCVVKGFFDREQERLNLMVTDRHDPGQADMVRGLYQGIL